MVPARPPSNMYLLYVDDAGSVGNPNEKHFVLGGVALFERQVYHFDKRLEDYVATLGLSDPDNTELHANAILAGRGKWRKTPREKKRHVILDALNCCDEIRKPWALFGVVVNKAAISPRDPIEFAFEQLISRFDMFLARQRGGQSKDLGLVIFDKSARETRLQTLTTEFRSKGHTWGKLHNICEVPVFIDSRASRLIQFADLVTYAIWRKFEKDDPDFFNAIETHFDNVGGVVHGFLHERYADSACDCPYCVSRR